MIADHEVCNFVVLGMASLRLIGVLMFLWMSANSIHKIDSKVGRNHFAILFLRPQNSRAKIFDALSGSSSALPVKRVALNNDNLSASTRV